MSRDAFVLGHPISHSQSPLIHNSWLAQYGIEGSYRAIDVDPAGLVDFFARLRAGEFVGGNVTIPHKQAVWELADMRDDQTRMIGAANTLIVRSQATDRIISATNTDWIGFAANLDEQAPGWDQQGGEALVLGAGGASRAIIIALSYRGYSKIHILNRTEGRAIALAKELGRHVNAKLSGGGLQDFAHLAPNAGVLVNTTSLGMHGTRFEMLDISLLKKDALVTDIVYTPLMTPLLAEASQAGYKTVDGLGMLLHQAVPGFEAWFGTKPVVTSQLRHIVERAMGLA